MHWNRKKSTISIWNVNKRFTRNEWKSKWNELKLHNNLDEPNHQLLSLVFGTIAFGIYKINKFFQANLSVSLCMEWAQVYIIDNHYDKELFVWIKIKYYRKKGQRSWVFFVPLAFLFWPFQFINLTENAKSYHLNEISIDTGYYQTNW